MFSTAFPFDLGRCNMPPTIHARRATRALCRRVLIRQFFHVDLFAASPARTLHPRLLLITRARRKVIGMPIFKMSVHRPLRMIRRILNSLDYARFERLIVLG